MKIGISAVPVLHAFPIPRQSSLLSKTVHSPIISGAFETATAIFKVDRVMPMFSLLIVPSLAPVIAPTKADKAPKHVQPQNLSMPLHLKQRRPEAVATQAEDLVLPRSAPADRPGAGAARSSGFLPAAPFTVLPLVEPQTGTRALFKSSPRHQKTKTTRVGGFVCLVPRRGLEPPRPCDHRYLKPARLPVPPPGHGAI